MRSASEIIRDLARTPFIRATSAILIATLAPRSALAEPPVPATERCSRGSTVRGIDVSSWQGNVDWAAVHAAGIAFAYVRVSDGSTAVDPAFFRNWVEARRVGIARGAYQYFRPAEDPDQQADLLIEMMGALRKGDLPPAIDVEVSGDTEPDVIVARTLHWLRRVEKATTLKPVLYTSAESWSVLTHNSPLLRNYALWIAHHGVDCPRTPRPWQRWSFHQSSAEGEIAGIAGPVDEDVFQGTPRALRRLGLRGESRAKAAWKRWRRTREE